MAIIKNVDKLRIREIEENLANDKVLTIDSTGLVAWKNQDEITPDLSAYYTKDDIDALLENISYTGGDGIDITNNEIRIKQSVLDEINANTNKTLSDVTSEGNTTNVKMIGSEVFSNTMKEDYAQIKDVNDSGWGLLPLQSEMKIALTAKDGTTVLNSIDVSWLASGDLAVSIDDTDPENPELVFSQGGVEVARIPASTLLSGVVRGGGLSDYRLQFKDGNNTVLFDIDLEDLFDQHYTKIEADGRFALRTRTITGTGSLTGGGDLTDDRTIDLSTTAKSDINKGVTAHDWGDFRNYGLGRKSTNLADITSEAVQYARIFRSVEAGHQGGIISLPYDGAGSGRTNLLRLQDGRGYISSSYVIEGTAPSWRELWHTGNFTPSNYYTKNEALNQFVGLSGVQDIADTKTFLASPVVPNPTLDGHAANRGWVEQIYFRKQLSNIANLDSLERFFAFKANNAESTPVGYATYGSGFTMGYSDELKTQIYFLHNGLIQTRNMVSGVWQPVKTLADIEWVNAQGFIKSLSNYYTKTEANDRFVRTTGVQNIADTKTFLASPVVPNPTLDAHAVNKGWVEENYKIQLVKIRDANTLAPNDDTFLSLNNLVFVEGDIPILLGAGYKEIIVNESGLYEIKFIGNAVDISGALYVLINNSQQDSPLLFSGSNGVIASGSFVYKLEPDDTIKFKASNQDNYSNLMSFTIVIQKLN